MGHDFLCDNNTVTNKSCIFPFRSAKTSGFHKLSEIFFIRMSKCWADAEYSFKEKVVINFLQKIFKRF